MNFPGFSYPLELSEKGVRLLARCTESKSGRLRQAGGIVFSVSFSFGNSARIIITLQANAVGANGHLLNAGFRNGINMFHLLDEAVGWK